MAWALYEFENSDVGVGKLSWITGKFDEHDEDREYLVEWPKNGKNGLKTISCTAKVLFTGDRADMLLKESEVCGSDSENSPANVMGKGLRRKKPTRRIRERDTSPIKAVVPKKKKRSVHPSSTEDILKKYRDHQRETEEKQQTPDSIMLKRLESRNAELAAELAALQSKNHRLQERNHQLQGEISSLQGELSSLKDGVISDVRELLSALKEGNRIQPLLPRSAAPSCPETGIAPTPVIEATEQPQDGLAAVKITDLLRSRCCKTNAAKYTNDLMHGIWSTEFMGTHSCFGYKTSPNPKPPLPREDVNTLVAEVKATFPEETDSRIKGYMRAKLNNMSKVWAKKTGTPYQAPASTLGSPPPTPRPRSNAPTPMPRSQILQHRSQSPPPSPISDIVQ